MSLEKKIEENTQALNRMIEVLENKKLAADHQPSLSASNNATRADAQKSLVRLSEKYGKDPAKNILSQFDAKKIGDLDEKNYSAVINTVEDFFRQEAS